MQQIQVRVKSKYNLINYIYILLIYRTLNWKKSVDETERFLDGKNLPCVLVENKSDLLDQNKVNNLTELKKFAKENEFVGCFRTSAKTGYNIEEAMKPYYFIINGYKIAFVNATRAEKNIMTPEATETEGGVFRCYDPTNFSNVIKETKKNSDYVVALIHYGREDSHNLEDVQVESSK